MNFSKNAILLAGILLTAFGSLRAQVRQTREEYIDRYKSIAVAHMERYGIPASITMAQGILESDCGNSRLSLMSNNHFGIKCKRNWTGEKVYHDDDLLALGGGNRRVKHQIDKRQAALHMILVNAAHHRALMHGGMLADHIFDHGGEHLEAIVTDDEPLDPAVQIDEAVLVQIADVTGMHPGL